MNGNKDGRKRRDDRLSEGMILSPYMKKMPSFFKKVLKFSENTTTFFKNIKVFLQHSA